MMPVILKKAHHDKSFLMPSKSVFTGSLNIYLRLLNLFPRLTSQMTFLKLFILSLYLYSITQHKSE